MKVTMCDGYFLNWVERRCVYVTTCGGYLV